MADIFISYAKADRALVETLAAMLEAEGWTVWFDRSLKAGDDFRDEIMRELAAARAVIAVWTETSIRSDWVRSEAGRAHADRKLIPVKRATLDYKDLPQPFELLHTETLDKSAAIKAAVVAQLAKPAVTPSGWWLATRELRFQALTWFGIVGGALTLFSGLGSLIALAEWARWLVEHWQAWTHGFWSWVGSLVGVRVSRAWAPLLSLLAFALSVAVGQRVHHLIIGGDSARSAELHVRSLRSLSVLITGFLSASIWWSLLWTFGRQSDRTPEVMNLLQANPRFNALLGWTTAHGPLVVGWFQSVPWTVRVAAFWTFMALPFLLLVWAARARFSAAMVATYSVLITAVLVLAPLNELAALAAGYPKDSLEFLSEIFVVGAVSTSLAWLMAPVMLLIAPARALARRLTFLAIGVVILLALNELSKLGVSLRPPR
jgi:hypothetical protein